MGRTLCHCIFIGIIPLCHSTCSWVGSFLMLISLRSFVIKFVSVLWRWPKYLCLHQRISLGTLIILSFLWNSWVLILCSSWTPQIQQTIPLSADVKRHFVLLDAGHFSQPYSKLFLIQELKMLPRFLSEIPRLVMIGNSCRKPSHVAVMSALIASAQPLVSPITSPRHWKVGTISNLSSPTCTWVEFKLPVDELSPLHFLHLNMLSFFSVP